MTSLLFILAFSSLKSQKLQHIYSQLENIKEPDQESQIFKINQLVSDPDKKYDEKEVENAVRFIADDIDWKTFYTSGNWAKIITLWVDLYSNYINDVFSFSDDFDKIGNKITDPAQYADFAKKTAFALTKNNRIHYINSVAAQVRASGKISDYKGILATYIKAAEGTYVSDLTFKEKGKDIVLKSKMLADGDYLQTMLLFYASGCGPCENLLQQLPDYLDEIKNKKIKIISISADPDEKTFQDKAKDLPWKDKYWDNENITGMNFQNYAITGTPTIFLLDKTGKILVRTYSLDELLDYINKK